MKGLNIFNSVTFALFVISLICLFYFGYQCESVYRLISPRESAATFFILFAFANRAVVGLWVSGITSAILAVIVVVTWYLRIVKRIEKRNRTLM